MSDTCAFLMLSIYKIYIYMRKEQRTEKKFVKTSCEYKIKQIFEDTIGL